jgi:hypothetical protein
METKVTTPAIKGLILSLVLIVVSLVTIYANQMENKPLGFLPILVLAAGVIWGCITYSNQMNHNVTFGNVFGHGFKITATVIVIMVVYSLLLFLVIKPDMQEISIAKARETLEGRNMSESDIDNALAITKKMFIPFAIGGIVIMDGLIGCIASLIGAGVAKKNPNPTPFQQ